MIGEVAEAVEKLPEAAAEQKLKKAVLTWGIEDARASLDAGLGTSARDVLADVQAHLAKDIGRRVEPSKELLPPVNDFDNNPYAQGLLDRVRSVLNSKTLYKKGDEGYRQIDNAWTFSSLGNNVYAGAWGLCCPDSPHAADPELLVHVLRLMQAIFQNHRDGDFNPGREAIYGNDPNINRFCFVPTFEAYLLLSATYPDLVLPSKRAEWLASAQVATEFQIESYGERAKNEPPECYYANMDVHYMLMLELAARMFNSPRYHEEAERFCKLTADVLYPDGAFSYIGFQNECFTYHQINVAHLARYWQLTGSELARDTVVKSRPYYPYNVEPGGVPEYYTDCFWKHYWSGTSPHGPGDRRRPDRLPAEPPNRQGRTPLGETRQLLRHLRGHALPAGHPGPAAAGQLPDLRPQRGRPARPLRTLELRRHHAPVRRRPAGQGHVRRRHGRGRTDAPLPAERRPASRHQSIPPRAPQARRGQLQPLARVPLPLARRTQRGHDRQGLCRAHHALPHPERGLGRQVDAHRLGRQSAVDSHAPAARRRARNRAPVRPASLLHPRPHPLRTRRSRSSARTPRASNTARWFAASTNTTTRT